MRTIYPIEKVIPVKTIVELPIAVTAEDSADMERQLDEAVTIAKAWAMQERRHGILVTRHGYGSFTVAISDVVPFGLTRESQDW